jgi:hypothetical protein
MPLGLLAKDSIQDLESLHKEAIKRESSSFDSATDTELDALKSKEDEAAREPVGAEQVIPALPPTGETEQNPFGEVNGPEIRRRPSEGEEEGEQEETQTTDSANPQQAADYDRKATANDPVFKGSTYGQYTGFRSDYYSPRHQYEDDDAYYHHDGYAPPPTLLGGKQEEPSRGFLCCFFPWMAGSDRQIAPEDISSTASEPISAAAEISRQQDPSQEGGNRRTGEEKDEEDGESTSSDFLGEKLSDKDRQAVLARLRLAQPEATVQSAAETPYEDPYAARTPPRRSSLSSQEEKKSPGSSVSHKKGLLNGIPVYDTSPLEEDLEPKPLKGILKKRAAPKSAVTDNCVVQASISENASAGSGPKGTSARRRSLFPSYESMHYSTDKTVKFASMARVVVVKSRNSMTDDEKGDIWWRRSDYEDFRHAGRIITKAMIEGGSEIWLTSSLSKENGSPPVLKHADSFPTKKPGDLLTRSTSHDSSASTGDIISATGDKWWHKFGHSRRGLEHVVSMEEGRQRQMNVRTAIRSVLEEQSRQKLYKREDAEKLRTVSLHYTTWARDLALASGASDADAVKSSFAEDRRSREFFLLKMARNKNLSSKSLAAHGNVPQFMQPAMRAGMLSAAGPVAAQQRRLDANTAAQIRYRIHQETEETQAAAEEKAQETCEPVHDPDPTKKAGESLAQQAAGFLPDSEEKVNMAAVLSGMGAVAKTEPHIKVAS